MEISIEELFHQVADLSAEGRDRHFTTRGIEPGLRREVEALVAFDADASRHLEKEVGHAAQHAIARLQPAALTCGPYQLGSLLGRGGMGTVFLAERADGECARRVAVKLPRPGPVDPEVSQRFLAERRILASLSHPRIVQLLDAGHRDDGQPYLVMEYVQGKPIDEYAVGLSVRRKIELFLDLCEVVRYLHQNQVVHRDLKPANILVTEQGEPKLLDFGLAKILDSTMDAAVTNMPILTPDYGSPEQVAGGPVTTATDIYSMGAVLYKLLTGESPHKFDGNSVEALVQTICTGEIVPPVRLAPEIKRDLETVVMKALRKEPNDRYATVEQFAEDLKSCLESRPIRARKGEAWYRTRRLARRPRSSTLAAALVAALAVAGLLAGLPRVLPHKNSAPLNARPRKTKRLPAARVA